MSSPAKRRKLNTPSKNSSPLPARNLDFFFAKKTEAVAKSEKNVAESTSGADLSALTDEELAKKLQAEFDQESVAPASKNGETSSGESKPREVEESSVNQDVSADGPVAPDNNEAEAQVKVEQVSAPPMSAPPLPQKNTLSLQSAGTDEDTICAGIPFDESPLTFDPSKYIPELQKHWAKEGGDASYALLTRCFVQVNSTQSRIKIVDTLVNMLRTIIEGDPASLLPTVRTQYRHTHTQSCVLFVYLLCRSSNSNALRYGSQPILFLPHISHLSSAWADLQFPKL